MQDKMKLVGHLFVSILLALVLFFYATTTNYKNSASGNQSMESETYTHTITNVPITMNYDSNTYFISGFSSTANVELTGANRLILQKETDEATRTFHISVDLTELGSGTHTVPLQIMDLPTGITASLNPAEITVKIGKKVSKTFPVQGIIYDNQLASGYTVSKITVGLENVKVTTDEDTMSKIARVEAVLLDVSNLSENYSGTGALQAVDAEGNVLPAVLSQVDTSLQATITKTK
ncbi:TPA: YbbR-like domain-containing protein [Streptococcus suis]